VRGEVSKSLVLGENNGRKKRRPRKTSIRELTKKLKSSKGARRRGLG